MDGTLLDLNFDTHFWREHVPLRYAEKHSITVEQAKSHLMPKFQAIEGTMNWYCLDYWSAELDLDIVALKKEIEHLIAVHKHVLAFLTVLRDSDKRLVLVTNAHEQSLALKMERTAIEPYFDNIISSHTFGKPKEEPTFWRDLHETEPFQPAHTLLVDDSLSVLRSAKRHGISHLVTLRRPDSQAEARDIDEFPAIDNFAQIMPPKTSWTLIYPNV